MSELWLLSEAQMRRIEPYFPLSHGIPRVDDRRIVSGIIYVIRGGLMWRDAPKAYGGTVRNFVRGAIEMDRKDHRYGNRQGRAGPASGWS